MPLSQDTDRSHLGTRPPPKPYSGWALDGAVDLDGNCPGLLAASFRFGGRRRQALFLVLAFVQDLGVVEVARRMRAHVADPVSGDEAFNLVARNVLALRRPQDLVRAVIGIQPNGLLGTLARLGQEPADEPQTYLELVRLFSSDDAADRRRAKVLGQIGGKLVHAQVQIVNLLDPVLLHPALVAKLYEIRQVPEIHCALAYVRAYCSGASDDAIRASLGRIGPDGHRADVIKAWGSRFDRLPATLDTSGDPTLHVLSSAAALIDAGRRYKNCLATKLTEVVLGAYLFVEYRPLDRAKPGLIAELRRTNQGYVLEGIHAADNRRALTHRADAFRERLAACGVAILAYGADDPEGVAAAAQMLGAHNLREADIDGWGNEMLEVADDLHTVLDEAA